MNSEEYRKGCEYRRREFEKDLRPIKFRAWHEEGEKMLTITAISFDEKWCSFEEEIEVGCRNMNSLEPPEMSNGCNLNEVKLMQWAGFRDKNGKEIYYGDIVYGGYGSGMEFTVNDIFVGYWFIDEDKMNNPHKYYEVIGNVFQPPSPPPLTEEEVVDKSIVEKRMQRMMSARKWANEIGV